MRKIPGEIERLYQGLGLKTRAYIRLRWKLCPFETIANFLPSQGIIIDAGCGYGLLSNYLALDSLSRQIIGIDSSLDRVAVARATVGQRENIKFIQKDINDFDFPQYQAMVMSDFLHHLPANISHSLLNKISNTLEHRGQLIIQEVDRKPYWKYLLTLLIDRFLNPFQKLNYQPVEYWRNLLKEIGFQVEIRPVHQGLPLADVILICTKK